MLWRLATFNHEFRSMIDTSSDHQAGTPSGADVWEFIRAVIGNVILLLVLVGVERLFFDQGFYATLIQHPFWIVVLIAAVHDGLFVGVLIAVASTALMDWPSRPAEVDITAHYIQVAILPLQWVLAALCIGLFRQAELRKAMLASTEMKRLQRVNEVLAADIMTIEAQIAHMQLETLSRDETQDGDTTLVGKILALQGADMLNLVSLFGEVADLCTPFPARVLLKTVDGEFSLLDADQPGIHVAGITHFTTEQMQSLRMMSEVISPRAAPFDQYPECKFSVVVGITSPARRTLHGAVEMLVPDSKSTDQAASAAQFLAIQLAPVLARLRMPTIAVAAETSLTDDRVRKLSHG